MTRIPTKKHKAKERQRLRGIGDTMGSSTGEEARAIEAGGWAGTDDATSTAPSDEMGNPSLSEEEKPFHTITRDFDESIQLDEERQEESAEEAEEAREMMTLAEDLKKRAHKIRSL